MNQFLCIFLFLLPSTVRTTTRSSPGPTSHSLPELPRLHTNGELRESSLLQAADTNTALIFMMLKHFNDKTSNEIKYMSDAILHASEDNNFISSTKVTHRGCGISDMTQAARLAWNVGSVRLDHPTDQIEHKYFVPTGIRMERCGWGEAEFALCAAGGCTNLTFGPWNSLFIMRNSLKHDNDLLGIAKRDKASVTDPTICSIALGGGNHANDITYLWKVSSPDDFKGYKLLKLAVEEYAVLNNSALMKQWVSDASGASCDQIWISGWSWGGAMAQVHRVAYGQLNEDDSTLSQFCFPQKKPCRLFAFAPAGGIWFGARIPTLKSADDNSGIWFSEDDEALTLVNNKFSQKNSKSLHMKNIPMFHVMRNLTIQVGPNFMHTTILVRRLLEDMSIHDQHIQERKDELFDDPACALMRQTLTSCSHFDVQYLFEHELSTQPIPERQVPLMTDRPTFTIYDRISRTLDILRSARALGTS